MGNDEKPPGHDVTGPRSCYTYAQAAIAGGFLVLVAGAISVAAFVQTSTAQITLGALTGLGSALASYIATTYLKIYNTAQRQLNFYFEEPLIGSYLLTAERLADNLSDERRDDVYVSMVDQIMLSARRSALLPDSSQDRRVRNRRSKTDRAT